MQKEPLKVVFIMITEILQLPLLSSILIVSLPEQYSSSYSTVQRRARTERNFPLHTALGILPLPCVAQDNL